MQRSDARHGVSVSVCDWLEYCLAPYILCIDAQSATSCGDEIMTKFLEDFMSPGRLSENEMSILLNVATLGTSPVCQFMTS